MNKYLIYSSSAFIIPLLLQSGSSNSSFNNGELIKIIVTVVITAIGTTFINRIFSNQNKSDKYDRQEDITQAVDPLDRRIDKIEDDILHLRGIYSGLKEQSDRIGEELRSKKELEEKLKTELSEIKGDVKVVMALIESLKEVTTELKFRRNQRSE